jgi:hypothetical protein
MAPHQPSPTCLAAAARLSRPIPPRDPGAQHKQDAGQRHLIQHPRSVTSPEREELTKLRRANHRLRQERGILAKAAA